MKRTNNTNRKINITRRMLIMFAAVITAIAVAVTCALCIPDSFRRVSVDNAQQGEVHTSATAFSTSAQGSYSFTSTTTTLTTSAAGSIANGDTLTFNYAAPTTSVTEPKYTVTLPKGTYTLTAYGAQGGSGCASSATAVAGAQGGTATGTYKITTATTFYIYVGGKGSDAPTTSGASAAVDGGYNGGGKSGTNNYSTYYKGGGGGGATHIATQAGLLSSLESVKTTKIIMVAGGGGGAGYSASFSQGTGGGETGTTNVAGAASGASHCATGGSQTAGGQDLGTHGSRGNAGSFGQGGAGATASTKSGGGGGGGGYYGGAGGDSGNSTACGGGGGGSGYIGGAIESGTMTNGGRAGDGMVVITVVDVNKAPTTKSYTYALGTRGSVSKTISVSDLASDPDGNSIYFSNGTAGSYDTSTNFTTNSGLWLDTACSISANRYFTWTTSGNTSFTINSIVAYPRAGQTGVSSTGGTVTLYTYIRDNYGAPGTRGCSRISFTLTVSKTSNMALKTSGLKASVKDSAGITSSIDCLVGNSNTTTAPDDPTVATSIYNPGTGSRSTIFVKKMLMLGGSITLTASDLVSNVSSLDTAVIALSDLTNITGASRKFKVTQYDNSLDSVTTNDGDKVTAYSTSGGTIANTFSKISIECVSPTPGYQVLPITIYVVEKSAFYNSAMSNVALWDSSSTSTCVFTTEIVFKMENTRPVLKSGVSNIVDVNVGETKTLNLNNYFSDVDNSAGINVSTTTHKLLGVTLPKKELLALDRLQNTVTFASPNANYYNIGNKVGNDTFDTTALSDTDTGFLDGAVYTTGSTTSSMQQAFMSYSFNTNSITVTGLRASYSQYKQNRAKTAPGHFYLLLHMQDLSDPYDNGIWLPIAFTVGATASHTPVSTVTTPNSVTSQTASASFPTANGSVGQSFYFAPMAINYNGSNVIGQYKAEDANGDNTGALTSSGLQPLAIDGDNFATANGTSSWNGGKLNEFLQLNTTPQAVASSVSTATQVATDVWQNQYFTVRYVDIYIPTSMFATAAYGGGRVVAASGTAAAGFNFVSLGAADNGYYIIKGLKITLRSATMNRFVYALAGVIDSAGKPSGNTIKIAVRVNNTAPKAFTDKDKVKDDNSKNAVVTFGDSAIDSAYSTYEYATGGTPTFTYKVPFGSTFIVTPYDLAYDADMTVGGTTFKGGFTLNGYSGRYNPSTGVFTTGSTSASDGATEVNGLFDSSYQSAASALLGSIVASTTVANVSANASGTASGSAINTNQTMYRDRLFFDRTTAGTDAYTYNPTTFANSAVNYTASNVTNFVNINFGRQVKIGSPTYDVDFMLITALNRTSQPSIIDLTVRDRYGSGSSDGNASFTVRVVIEVVNTKPNIKNAGYYKELSVKPIQGASGVVTPDTAILYADGNGSNDGLMEDRDKDTPEFVLVRGVAIVNKTFIDDYKNSISLSSFDGLDNKYFVGNGVSLTRYIGAELLTRRELSVTAYSSTKAIEGGVFVAFFVTDNNGGTSLGYVQVEVLNTAPTLNESEVNGFNSLNPMWYVESTSDADIMRDRYIVGSESAFELVKSKKGAMDIDIKLISADDDALHNNTVLSQISAVTENGNTTYLYATIDTSNYNSTELEAVVPKIDDATGFNGTASAVKLFRRNTETGNLSAGAPTGYRAELNFFVLDVDSDDGRWYTRDELISALTAATNPMDIHRVFDDHGRFILSDWALLLRATSGFESSIDLGIALSLRDQAELGGSTAGLKTAYNSDRNHKNEAGNLDNLVVVEGMLLTTVYQHINKTGIRTINEYLGVNDNYYTVEYAQKNQDPVRFISTYDGNVNSTYATAQSSLYYAYGTNNEVVLANSGDSDKLIKSRGKDEADGTLAGTNSGAIYSSSTTAADLVGAFQYTDTIELPAETVEGSPASGEQVTYRSVYVPMSYFGLLSTLATADASDGSVTYPEDFVGYEVNYSSANNPFVSLTNINQIVEAMVLSDGTREWKGTEIISAENPYFKLEAFDWYNDNNATTNSAALYNDVYSRPYYNNRLAVATLNPSDNTLIGFERTKNSSNATVVNSENAKSFVGDGRLMYLEKQATDLIEHNFGLVFTKKNVRTSTRNLTLTINLARYNKESGGGRLALTGGKVSNVDRGTVEVKIHIENTKLDLFNNDANTSNVKYDSVKGTYYVDVDLASSETATYKLSRRAVKEQTVLNDKYTLEYYDDDYGTQEKRDTAYFSSDSLDQLSQWQIGEEAYNRVLKITDDNTKFVNVLASSDKAQKSVANYFGVKYSELAKLTESGSVYQTGSYKPNNGIYGSATNKDKTRGKEGYSSYFNASLMDGGTSLSILPVRKTFINEIAFGKESDLISVDKTDREAVKAAYLERGLVAEYQGLEPALYPSRVYYPLRVLIYDSFGVGFNDASYVAIEFRVSITNGAPSLKTVGESVTQNGNEVGRQYSMNLAVGTSATINLYDIVYDSDIFTYTSSSVNMLATQNYFETNASGVVIETGDYLDSPLKHDEFKNATYNPVVQQDGDIYYYNGGGFVSYGSEDFSTRDVVMWMSTDTNGVPFRNEITFNVHRRTTTKINKGGKEVSVAVNQYRFTLKFYDGTGTACTAPFTFIINIANQTPSLIPLERSFTMRSGDDLTLLATYYDYFTGAVGDKTDAYENSESYVLMTERQALSGYGTTFGDGHNNLTGNGRYWVYSNITSTAERNSIVYNSTVPGVRPETGSMHLGYVGLANDDTPWKLRITDWKYNENRLRVEYNEWLELSPEGGRGNYTYTQMAIRVVAIGACVNEPVTVELSDCEGGTIVSTLYFTIVSSPPIPLDCNDNNNRVNLGKIGLEGVENQNNGWVAKTYRTFIVPSEKAATFNVDGFDAPKTARRVTTISMSSIARDPDENETENMRLYGNGSFTVNGSPLVSDSDGVYRSDYFNIQPSRDGRSFDIIATGYNPDTLRGYEILTFRIEDYGNSAYSNSVEVTLHIYTLYSDLTNPSAVAASETTAQYNSYLGGAEVVNVKSYDEYYGPNLLAKRSTFAFVDLLDNDGEDNTSSPIVDPDASVKGDANYNVRLYAFVDVTDGAVKPLSETTLRGMLDPVGSNKTFKLKANANVDYDDYLIGGLVDGSAVALNSAGGTRYSAVTKYVDFEFDADGTAIMFTPNASTLNSKDVLLYVEAEKPMGQRSVALRDGAVLNAGALFSLNVRDSAPQAVDGTHAVEGVKGDVGKFTVFNPVNKFDALFTDSDVGDSVTVDGMVNGKLADAEYENVMSLAETELPGLKWNADAATGMPRAFDLSVGGDGALEVKINRRVDYEVNGVCQPSVTIPLKITGVDKCGKKATTTVYLTIKNSNLTAAGAFYKFDPGTKVGYSFDINDMGEYEINVNLRFGVSLDVSLSDILADNDISGATYDADSYRFVSPKTTGSGYSYSYIVNETIPVMWYNTDSSGNPNYDDTKTLATAEPLGDNETHRTGIRFTATATERDLTAIVYVRVIDRAGNAELAENGVVIRINVIVMNDAPYVKDGMETTTLYMIGSQVNEPDSMLFYIGDFVEDNNASDVVGDDESFKNTDTYLRMSRQDPRVVSQLYSTTYESIPESFGLTGDITSSALFEVTTPAVLDDKLIRAYCERMGITYTAEFKDTTNLYNQWFVIKPRKGFYGNAAIDITVMDGDPGVKYDTLYTTFCIDVHVISNADEVIDDLSAIELACSKTRQVDIRSLMPDIENKLVLPNGDTDEENEVSTSADGNVFNQYAYYNIVSIGFQNEIDNNKATFTKIDNDGQLWEIKAGNQVTRDPVRVAVKFALKSDSTKTYTKYFYFNVIANRSPKAKYSQIEFKRYNKGEPDSLRDLTEANTIRLQAWQLFEDADDPEGTSIKFLAVESQVSSIVKAQLIRDDSGEYRYLELSFVGRGESEITVTVTDETGTPVKLKFTASNTDLPQASMWVRLAASFEANTVLWIVIICCVLLLIAILIIIIAVVRKRKRAREELEALLVSEMEIEEQMLKLAGGPAPTNYQSFGYLQGAVSQQPDPSMMLGAGEESAQPQLTALPPAQGEGGDVPPPDDDSMPM